MGFWGVFCDCCDQNAGFCCVFFFFFLFKTFLCPFFFSMEFFFCAFLGKTIARNCFACSFAMMFVGKRHLLACTHVRHVYWRGLNARCEVLAQICGKSAVIKKICKLWKLRGLLAFALIYTIAKRRNPRGTVWLLQFTICWKSTSLPLSWGKKTWHVEMTPFENKLVLLKNAVKILF